MQDRFSLLVLFLIQERTDKALEYLAVVLIGIFAGRVLESARNAELDTVGLTLAQIAFAADLAFRIEMDISKGARQNTHLAPHASLNVDLDGAGGFVPVDRSGRAHFQAPGIVALQAGYGEAYPHIVVIFDPDVRVFPDVISSMVKCARVFTVAAYHTFCNVHSNVTHRVFPSRGLIS
jgi:hypothetical protein